MMARREEEEGRRNNFSKTDIIQKGQEMDINGQFHFSLDLNFKWKTYQIGEIVYKRRSSYR